MARVVKRRKTAEPPATPLAGMREKHLEDLRVHHYSEYTIKDRSVHIGFFLDWCAERGITEPVEVTRTVLEAYQRYVFHYRKKDGEPLSFSGQEARIIPLRVWFKWMARHHHILHNPASELELPRLGVRLPKAVLTAGEADQVMMQTNIHDPLGLRDRAILETLYSTGMRRLELVNLKVWDLDLERLTVNIRQGKGKRDRVIPIGDRAAAWVRKYLTESRPQLATEPDDKTTFVCHNGEPFSLGYLSQVVRDYVDAANLGQARSLPSVPPHHGDADARRRSRYPFHSADARACRSEHHADLHARGHPPASGDPPSHASRQTRKAKARAAGRDRCGRRRGRHRRGRRCVAAFPTNLQLSFLAVPFSSRSTFHSGPRRQG
jgi:integrase/recombinase XerD